MAVTTVITPSKDKTVENKGVSNAVESNAIRMNNYSGSFLRIGTLKETHSRRSIRKKQLLTVNFWKRTIKCLILSSNFKLLDESQVLLRVPRKDNIYSVDLKSVVPSEGLTCLIAKATIDESNT
ncbi:hypothetical protein Tco_0797759 [Tanacetum coccineum]